MGLKSKNAQEEIKVNHSGDHEMKDQDESQKDKDSNESQEETVNKII